MPYPYLGLARRRVVRRLREGGAVSSDTARPLADLSRIERGRLARLLEDGAIREAEPGRYWLDVARYAVYEGRQRRLALLIVLAIIVAAVFVVELGRP